MQSWTSPGGNTPQDTNCTATCLLSRKLFKLDEPDMQDTAGEAGTNSYMMYSFGPPHMAVQKQDYHHEHTFCNYVRIQDVVLKTYLGRWTIGRSGETGSGISMLPAWWWFLSRVIVLRITLRIDKPLDNFERCNGLNNFGRLWNFFFYPNNCNFVVFLFAKRRRNFDCIELSWYL